jgi:hypothetical protein
MPAPKARFAVILSDGVIGRSRHWVILDFRLVMGDL